MEWAIHLGDGSRAEDWEELFPCRPPRSCESPLQESQARVAQLLERVAGRISPKRAYVGNEFCQSLIPTPEHLSRICRTLWKSGVEITFLTPPVTDEGLEKLRVLFSWLARQEHAVEVVFNDWGTLELLHQEFERLDPVRGRLLNKILRDPRVTPLYNSPAAPEGIRAALQPSSLDTPFLRQLMSRYRVRAVELDILVLSPDADFRQLPFEVSFYFPYGFVTTGRQCMMGSLRLKSGGRFQPGLSCQRECRLYLTEHRFSGTTLETNGTAFYQRGNTFFYCPQPGVLESFLERAEKNGVSRVVYEPGLPM
jgi:hypothetical protein